MKKQKKSFYNIGEIFITEIRNNIEKNTLYKANKFSLKPYIFYDNNITDKDKLELFNLNKMYLLTNEKNNTQIQVLKSDLINADKELIFNKIYNSFKLFNWYTIENRIPFLLIDYLLEDDNYNLMLIGLTFFRNGVNIISVNPECINIDIDYKCKLRDKLFNDKSSFIKFMMERDIKNTLFTYDNILYMKEKYIDNFNDITSILGEGDE